MRAGLALAATTLVASPAFAANEEWPDGPNKEFFRGLQRPDDRLGHPNSSALVAVPAMWSRPSLAASTRLEGAQ